jgi:hypothetical protein
MKKRIRIDFKTLKGIIRETLLREEADAAATLETNDSLDDQVDHYLAQYEAEAANSKNEGVDFRHLTRRFLSEADGDEIEPVDANEPEKKTIDDIDIDSFADSVVRLIENYENLLEFRDTIVKRALNHISKSHDASTVDSLRRIFVDEHSIDPGKSEEEVRDEKYPVPAADRAGGEGGGGGAIG